MGGEQLYSFGQRCLSVINHNSSFDNSGIWGAVLRPPQLADTASEVIFANRATSTFWFLGKVVLIVRGWGANQPAMEFLLNRKVVGWVNIFPEARDNADGSFIRYKCSWVGLFGDSATTPLILLVVHLGMDRMLPNPSEGESQTAIYRPGKLITINIGSPVDMGEM